MTVNELGGRAVVDHGRANGQDPLCIHVPFVSCILCGRAQRELDELSDTVPALEEALADLDRQLADPALYQGDASRVRDLQARREAAARDVAQATARWEELAERA